MKDKLYNVLFTICLVCVFVLLGVALQYVVWGVFTFSRIHYSEFTQFHWFLESVYIILLICSAILVSSMFDDDIDTIKDNNSEEQGSSSFYKSKSDKPANEFM